MSKIEQIERFLADSKNPVQWVKHWDDVKDKPEYPLVVQAKLDGVYSLIVKEHQNVQVFARTGKRMYKEALTIEDEVLSALSDGVFIAELVSEDLTLEELSGMVNPNRKEAWTPEQVDKSYGCMWAFHDYITHDELLFGMSPAKYIQRYATMQIKLPIGAYTVPYEYVYSYDDIKSIFDIQVDIGGEGVVIKDPDAGWLVGHKGNNAMKLVREYRQDLLCVDVQWGKGQRIGQVSALVFRFLDNTFKADLGVGWDDDTIKHLTRQYLDDASTVLGKIWELKGLQPSSTGRAIRLPKVVRIRDDKNIPDDEGVPGYDLVRS